MGQIHQKRIFVNFEKEGIHCYPDAKNLPGVEFLQYPHRHLFKFTVMITVDHNDREIEFILFKRELMNAFDSGVLELNYKSCEMIADDLYKYIEQKYPNRHLSIIISEDGENGCIAEYNT